MDSYLTNIKNLDDINSNIRKFWETKWIFPHPTSFWDNLELNLGYAWTEEFNPLFWGAGCALVSVMTESATAKKYFWHVKNSFGCSRIMYLTNIYTYLIFEPIISKITYLTNTYTYLTNVKSLDDINGNIHHFWATKWNLTRPTSFWEDFNLN